jgi:thiosulfate/3-mercaptopyruvate sulfurtransferase
VFAHLDRDLAGAKTGTNGRHPLPSPAACAANFGRLGIDASKQVVAYDQNSGAFASRLWWMLRWLGHDAVAVLDGGFERWLREGRPVSALVPAPRPVTFSPRPVLPTVDADGVQAGLGGGSIVVIDARAPERFRGEAEPLDPVAGHIPGAVNRPFGRNLGADGAFKPAATLRGEFEALLAGRSPATVVHQCGSGVTACHNALAMEVAGLPGAALYPGSWSEWCADPSRPVARGD